MRQGRNGGGCGNVVSQVFEVIARLAEGARPWAIGGLALLAGCGSDHTSPPSADSSPAPPSPSSLAVFQVRDINAGTFSSLPSDYREVAGTVFFVADDGFHGRQLWRSDGTPAGTSLVKDLGPANGESGPRLLAGVGRVLFFGANDGARGDELWKTDGTEAGTMLVRDIVPGRPGSFPGGAVNVDGTLFFSAQDDAHGREPWRSDGTAAGTVMIKDVYPGAGFSVPEGFTPLNGAVFFLAYGPAPVYGREGLWKTDGTESGTVLVRDLEPPGLAHASQLMRAGQTLFFTADDGVHGKELWKSDGTTAGTQIARDINPGGVGSEPRSLTALGTGVFFEANDGLHGPELWKSDGTEAGTVLVKDIDPGRSSRIDDLVMAAGRLYFSADDGVHGRELWTSDGTPERTVLVKDMNPAGSSSPSGLTAFQDMLVFAADDGAHGREMWRSDGTAAGTVLVRDVMPGPASFVGGGTELLSTSGRYVFFAAADAGTGTEPWAYGPPPPQEPAAPPTSAPPSGPNHSPEITAFGATSNISTASVVLTVSDSDGDDIRWTATLSRDDGKTGLGSLSCQSECTAIQVVDGGVSGLVRSGHTVALQYFGVTPTPDHPEGSVIVTANADDGRGGQAQPRSVRISIF